MANLVNITGAAAIGNVGDLTTPTSTQQYELGREIVISDPDNYKSVKKYKYVKSHTTLTQYQPYVITNTGTAGSEWITIAPATLATCGLLVGVPQVAVTSGYYFWCLIAGDGKALMTAETYAVGDKLELLNTGTAFNVDGTSSSTVTTIQTAAICKEAGSTAVARAVFLVGRPCAVQAS